MTHYMIDTENLSHEWAWVLSQVDETTMCHVFYTDRSQHVSIDMVEAMLDYGENLNFVKCHSGHNALDFQLVTLLGFMIALAPDDNFIIISKDTGFDPVVNFWVEEGKSVTRIGNDPTRGIPVSCTDSDFMSEIETALENTASTPEIKFVQAIIMRGARASAADYKSNVHGELIKKFQPEKGRTIYYACKEILERWHAKTHKAS